MIDQGKMFTIKLNPLFKFILSSSLIHSAISFHIIDDEQGSAADNISYISRSSNFEERNNHDTSKELPYIVMVITNVEGSLTVCTGTLISDNLVLTLASCLMVDINNYPNPDNIRVYERKLNNNDTKVEPLRASIVFINPKYLVERRVSKAFNFALIVTDKSKQQIAYPRLPDKMAEFQDVKLSGLMAGYGDADVTNLGNFKVISFKEAWVEQGKRCNVNEICLYFKKIMPCADDRGGPIIFNGTLYALYNPRKYAESLMTDEDECYDVYVTVFTPVYNVTDWMETIMNQTYNFKWLNNPWCVLLVCCFVFGAMGGIYYGLVEALQRICDPADMLQIQIRLSKEEEEEDQPYMSPWGRAS